MFLRDLVTGAETKLTQVGRKDTAASGAWLSATGRALFRSGEHTADGRDFESLFFFDGATSKAIAPTVPYGNYLYETTDGTRLAWVYRDPEAAGTPASWTLADLGGATLATGREEIGLGYAAGLPSSHAAWIALAGGHAAYAQPTGKQNLPAVFHVAPDGATKMVSLFDGVTLVETLADDGDVMMLNVNQVAAGAGIELTHDRFLAAGDAAPRLITRSGLGRAVHLDCGWYVILDASLFSVTGTQAKGSAACSDVPLPTEETPMPTSTPTVTSSGKRCSFGPPASRASAPWVSLLLGPVASIARARLQRGARKIPPL